MQSKNIVYIIVAVVAVGVVAFFALNKNSPNQQAMSSGTLPTSQNVGETPTTTGQTAAPTPQQTVTPIKTNVGSVAGIDLSEFSNQANQSASISSQDGSQDAKTISSDGSSINSSTDSVNNPIQ